MRALFEERISHISWGLRENRPKKYHKLRHNYRPIKKNDLLIGQQPYSKILPTLLQSKRQRLSIRRDNHLLVHSVHAGRKERERESKGQDPRHCSHVSKAQMDCPPLVAFPLTTCPSFTSPLLLLLLRVCSCPLLSSLSSHPSLLFFNNKIPNKYPLILF